MVLVDQSPANEKLTMLEVVGPVAVRLRWRAVRRVDPTVREPAIDGIILDQHDPDELLAQIRQATGHAFSWRNPTLVGDITSGAC